MSFSQIVSSLAGGGGRDEHICRAGSATRAYLAARLTAAGRNVVVFTRDGAELAACRALFRLFSPELSARDSSPLVPLWEEPCLSFPSFSPGPRGKAAWSDRLAVLYAMRRRSRGLALFSSLDTLIPLVPSPEFLEGYELNLARGADMAPDLVLDQAIEWGYTRASLVSIPGDIAVRGDILDIFCPGYARPVRLEFFGDTLEDIRLFDASSQRSLGSLQEVTILPVTPLPMVSSCRQGAARRFDALQQRGAIDAEERRALERNFESGARDLLPGVCLENPARLEAWFPPKSIFLLPSERDTAEALALIYETWRCSLEEQYELLGLRQPAPMVLRSPEDARDMLLRHDRAWFEDLTTGLEKVGLELPERAIHSFQELFPQPADQERPWQKLMASLRDWSKGREYERVILSFVSERSRSRFLALAEQDGIKPALRLQPEGKGIYALVSPFREGAYLSWDGTLILGEGVLQPKADKTAGRTPGSAFKGLESYDDLKEGDFLVHRDYGIASFGGLHRMELGGIANDYLLLHYAGDDKLYLPVDRLSLVQRYKTPDGGSGFLPSPDKLGSSQWFASKTKAQKAIEKIAEDLVQMYAYRKVAKGFTYGPIDEMYREFEASFGFEETPDQFRAIQDVLTDMEKPEPMDRLVCGDVGFGKTEVALRAAFRASLEGRQVALLCPTTVLAEQHFQTFRARLGAFPVSVGLLSRFVAPTRQKEVLAAAARGQIDILIGTHRILSKDVSLPNLGLLILDEEQRFGVRHKERLKELRKNVDVLTLTATPIPRTLQLSLSGIRELSVIETAPRDRKPVATAIINREETALRAIIERELAREGQVFWVYNRVQGLERVAEFVRKLVPSARIGMAHGQMGERALEEAMHKFWHGELDVLVCTAIVESGLDFPRANTLIVDQAQLFGLGQLYQLRGRVGRSDRQAYAVFVVQDADRLQENARKRLRVILELDYLGAGFQVAMEDLRMRGAGNILGESQSGHMTRLGLDLFLEMLEEAVAKLKGEPLAEHAETEVSLSLPAHIPEGYIGDPRERLKYYKALSSAATPTAQQDIELEMRDRFGPWPEELGNFLAVLSFKRFLRSLGVPKADIRTDGLRLNFHEKESGLDAAKLLPWVMANQERVRLLPPAGLDMSFKGLDVASGLAWALDALSALRAS